LRQNISRQVARDVDTDEDEEYEDEEEVVVEQEKWVQCSRCEQWRIVPDHCWDEIQNDPREDWFCEDAKWNVTTTNPFTPPCNRSG